MLKKSYGAHAKAGLRICCSRTPEDIYIVHKKRLVCTLKVDGMSQQNEFGINEHKIGDLRTLSSRISKWQIDFVCRTYEMTRSKFDHTGLNMLKEKRRARSKTYKKGNKEYVKLK